MTLCKRRVCKRRVCPIPLARTRQFATVQPNNRATVLYRLRGGTICGQRKIGNTRQYYDFLQYWDVLLKPAILGAASHDTRRVRGAMTATPVAR